MIKSKRTLNRVIALALSLLMILSVVPISSFYALAYTQSTLETNLESINFVVNEEPQEFTVTSTANDDVNKMVKGYFEFSNPDVIETLEYYETTPGYEGWHKLTGEFGPETGFPVIDGESKFRVAFNTVGEYSVKIALKDVETSEIYCSATAKIKVDRNAAVLTTNIASQNFVVNGEPAEFTVTSTANDDINKMVKGSFQFSNPDAIETLEYYETTPGYEGWHKLTAEFGPETGFPVIDGTSKFRVAFNTAGEYSVEITLKDLETSEIYCSTTAQVIVSRAKTGVKIEPKVLAYNEQNQALVSVEGIEIGDIISWNVDGEGSGDITVTDLSQLSIPKKQAVNKEPGYSVTLTVNRGTNYEIFTETVNTKIIEGELNLDGLTVNGLNGVYTVDTNGNPVEQEVVTVTPESGYSYKLKYQLDDGDLTVNETGWVDDIPTVINAGSYIVWVKAVKEGYTDKDVPVNPAAGAIAPYNVYVAKADQKLEFATTIPSEVVVDEENIDNNVYNFSVVGENLSGKDIIYELVDGTSDQVASIDGNGKLKVANAGIVTVKASRESNSNYESAVVYATVRVKKSSNGLLTFAKENVNYILDDDGIVSTEAALKTNNDDNGSISYKIDKTDIGLEINSSTGTVTITNRGKLAKAMGRAGSVSLVVTAEKAAGTVTAREWYYNNLFDWSYRDVTKEVYSSATVTYSIVITYDAPPKFDAVCTISEPAATGWYNSTNPAVISSIDNTKYSIALDTAEDKKAFADTVTVTAQGTDTHYIFVKNLSTKRISAGIPINIKVDDVAPDANKMTVKFDEVLLFRNLENFLVSINRQ